MSLELRMRLQQVARRLRKLRVWSGLAVCWLFWAAAGIAALEIARRLAVDVPLTWKELAALAGGTAFVWLLIARRATGDQLAVARRIEARHPELATRLLAAIEQAKLPDHELRFLQRSVIHDAVAHSRDHNWNLTIPPWRLRLARLAQFLALGLLIGVCIGLADRAGANAGLSGALLRRNTESNSLLVEVDPGDTEIERGTSMLIVATFPGAVPSDATLEIAAARAETLPMTRSLEDPKFVGHVSEVTENLSYHVRFGEGRSATYQVKVFEYPELVRADARLVYPAYTLHEPATLEDVRQITAVEGTRITLSCRLNKEVMTATLLGDDGHEIVLRQTETDPVIYEAGWTLSKSQRLKVLLVDAEGRGSKLPTEIVIKVTPNRTPKLVLERPGRDVEVTPLEELQLSWQVSDDFGVVKSGVTYSIGGGENREIPFDVDTTKEFAGEHLLDLESHSAKPDQLVSYHVWADDLGPSGEMRRTMSDMYFAEVRPFEEVFRQGEQPSESQMAQQGESGGSGTEAEELVELQKQIIGATWKIVRRKSGAARGSQLDANVRLVEQSQESVFERTDGLDEGISDAQSQAHLDEARTHMRRALGELQTALESSSAKPLTTALRHEQGAYEALLKLRAREHQVVRGGQQSGQPGRGGSRSRRQLQELELTADENRYETRNRARSPESDQAQQQNREILDRLKDLARRQEDVNERLRELQSSLEQARSPEEHRELERELKRLRDQQRELLRDSDELAGRMDESEAARTAQDARQKLERSRSHVKQATEALEDGQLPEAITEGARAGRQLNELRNEFRQQSAERFSQEMNDLRSEARRLDERQQELSQQLRDGQRERGRSLRESDEKSNVQRGIAEQRQELQSLLERMRETIEQAEVAEPLLARQLYDSVRKAHQDRVEDALDVARRLAEVGVDQQAGEAMRKADQGVGELRRGVERAAESVLGDEAEALRRARGELERLAEELSREIERGQEAERARSDSHPDEEPAATFRPSSDAKRGSEGPSEPSVADGEAAAGEASKQRQSEDGKAQQGSAESGQETQAGSSPGDAGSDAEGQAATAEKNDSRRPTRGDATRSPSADSSRVRRGGRERSTLRGGNTRSGDRGGLERLFDEDMSHDSNGPITGADFRDWVDRLSGVEEMLSDAALRNETARIRDRAFDARQEFKRHSKEPDWTKLRDLVAEPLVELSERIDEEIRRQESPHALVPIDRDPIPAEYEEAVGRYYERLGSGE